MKTILSQRAANTRALSILSVLVLLAGVSGGCGNKPAASGPAPYANAPNPAAVAPAAPSANAPGARGGPPEADAYRQKMGANAKAPGAR